MAVVRLVTASTTTSGSSGNCRAVQAYNLSSTAANGHYDDLGTSRNSGTFTLPNLRVMSGAGIWYRLGTRAGYFNIKLQKGGVDVAGATASLQVNTTNFPGGYGFATFQFGTPATGDGSSTYRLVCQCTTSTAFGGSAQNSSIYWFRDGTAGNYSYVTYDDSDTTTAITSGDTLVLDKSVALTQDSNVTLAPLAANGVSLWLGDASQYLAPNPASPITLDLGTGNIDYSTYSLFRVGTSTTDVAAGLNFTLAGSMSAGGFIMRSHYVLIDTGSTNTPNKIWQFYGATSETMRLKIGDPYSGSNVASQAKITFSESIPGTWADGDSIQLIAKNLVGADNGNAGAYYTIAVGGIDSANKTVTLNANLNYDVVKGGIAVNVTEATRACGIKLNFTNPVLLYNTSTTGGNETTDHIVATGIYAVNVAFGMPNAVGTTPTEVDGWIADFAGNQPYAPSFYSSPADILNTPVSTFNNMITISRSARSVQPHAHGLNMSFTKIAMQGFGGTGVSTQMNMNACSFNDIIAANGVGTGLYAVFVWQGYGNTINELYTIGASQNFYNASNYIITGGKQVNNVGAAGQSLYATSFSNATNIVFNNYYFGDAYLNTATGDVSFNYNGFGVTASYNTIVCNNCYLGYRGVDVSQSAGMGLCNQGSYIQFHNLNGITGNHATYKPNGVFYSLSPYTTLREGVLQTTATLSHQYSVLTQTVASKEFNLLATAQINASYYGGTYTAPKIKIYDDADPVTPAATLTFAATTGAQTLAQAFTPSTSNNQVIFDFQTKTDAYKSATVTFTAATDVVNWTGHGLSADDPIFFKNAAPSLTGSLPTVASGSFLPNTIYYVKTVTSADAFTISDTVGGTAKDLTSAGTGTTTCYAMRGECAFSNVKVLHRTYGNTFTSLDLGAITETLTYPIGTITTPVANPYITVSNSATVAGYTEFTINHATQTVTITADTTLDKLYDYSQYDLGLSANLQYSEWLTTLDGSNFTSTYSIVLNTGVDLTGGGSIEMETGTTFTRTGTATYDGYVINADGTRTVHIKLNGLVASSVVQIYNTTNSTEIDKTTVTGTTYDYYYTYSADKNSRVRVRNVIGTTGYLPYEATGTITNTGLTLNVSQEPATVYNDNNLDGSTPTEFSLTEGVIKVYIDDPDNITTFQRLYNWYLYSISTETYIDDQTDLITANSTRDYIFDDTLAIKNLDGSNPLYIYGANVRNNSGNNAIIDATGGSIFIRGDYPAASVGEIWGDTTSYSSSTGTKGKQLYDASSNSVDSAAIADAVWDELQSGHTTTGSFGSYLDRAVSSVGFSSAGPENKGITQRQLLEIAKRVWEYQVAEDKTAKEALLEQPEIPLTNLQPVLDKIDEIKIPEVDLQPILVALKDIKIPDFPKIKDYSDKLAEIEKTILQVPGKIIIPESTQFDYGRIEAKIDEFKKLDEVLGGIKQMLEDTESVLSEKATNETVERVSTEIIDLKKRIRTVLEYLVNMKYDTKQAMTDIINSKYDILEEVIK